jgi:hypothetical protein
MEADGKYQQKLTNQHSITIFNLPLYTDRKKLMDNIQQNLDLPYSLIF